MSFTSIIKNELVSINLSKLEQLSELSGFLRNSIEGKKKLNFALCV